MRRGCRAVRAGLRVGFSLATHDPSEYTLHSKRAAAPWQLAQMAQPRSSPTPCLFLAVSAVP